MSVGSDKRPWSLVIGAGRAQAAFLQAWSGSHRIAATDCDLAAGGRAWAECFAAIDARDEDAVLRFVEDALGSDSLGSVMSFASGEPQRTAGRLARRLGVPGPPLLLAEVAHSKRRLLEWLAGLELAPRGAVYASARDVARARLSRATGSGFLVPDRGGSGNGVARLAAPGFPDAVLDRAFELGGAGGMVLAPEVPGPEFVVTTIVRDGRIAFVSVGRSVRLADTIAVPLGQILGTDLDTEPATVLEAVAERVVKASGLQQGILGFEVILGPYGPVVLDLDLGYAVPVELARACGGGEIAEQLVAARPLVRAAEFPAASGLLYWVAVEGAVPVPESELRAIGDAHAAEFSAAPGSGSRFATSEAEYRRTGAWRVSAPDQAQVAARLAAIAQAAYGCGLR